MLLNQEEEKRQATNPSQISMQPSHDRDHTMDQLGAAPEQPVANVGPEGQNDGSNSSGEDQNPGSNNSSDVDMLLEDQLGQETFSEMSPRGQRIFKTFIVILFICIFAFVNLVPNMSLYKIECLHDYTHEYTQSVNEWFKENSGAKKSMMIVGGGLSDIITIITLGYWTVKVKTWRLPIALVLIYTAKAFTSLLFKYRYPDGYLWENPGFYSLTTPYGASNDMHFTLHVALLYVLFQELRTLKLYWVAPVAFFVFLYQAALALTTRGAYIIDLFAAFIFGHYFFVVGEQLSYYIDVSIFGLTFQERFPEFPTNCGKCKHPINQWTKNSVEDVHRAMANQRRQNQ